MDKHAKEIGELETLAHTLYIVGIGPAILIMWVPRGLNLIKHATVLVGSERSLGDFQEPGQITICNG